MSAPTQSSSIGRVRRRSRALVRQHQAHDPAAADFLRVHHPAFADLSNGEIFDKPISLCEAQRIIAHEHGQPFNQTTCPPPAWGRDCREKMVAAMNCYEKVEQGKCDKCCKDLIHAIALDDFAIQKIFCPNGTGWPRPPIPVKCPFLK